MACGGGGGGEQARILRQCRGHCPLYTVPVEAIHAGAEENVCGVEGEEGEEWREKEERRRWWTSCHLGRVLLHSQPSSACTG